MPVSNTNQIFLPQLSRSWHLKFDYQYIPQNTEQLDYQQPKKYQHHKITQFHYKKTSTKIKLQIHTYIKTTETRETQIYEILLQCKSNTNLQKNADFPQTVGRSKSINLCFTLPFSLKSGIWVLQC